MTSSTVPKRILIVHDERHISRLLRVNLERASHRVDVAENATEADALLRSSRYDAGMLGPAFSDLLPRLIQSGAEVFALP